MCVHAMLNVILDVDIKRANYCVCFSYIKTNMILLKRIASNDNEV